MLFGGVLCCIAYLIVSFSGLITSVLEERADFSAFVYALFCDFCLEGFPLSLGCLILFWSSLGRPGIFSAC